MRDIYHHTELDKVKWDAFVAQNNASIFSTSTYLDSTAKDWSVYVDYENNLGLVLPNVKKLGVKGMYPPFFHRYIEIIGKRNLPEELINFIQEEFKFGIIHSRQKLALPNESTRVHQVISDFENIEQSSQFKRSVKRAQKNNYTIRETNNVESSFRLIIGYLSSKLDFYKSNEINSLRVLVNNLFTNSDLFVFELLDQGEVKGALFVMKHQKTYTYLKGSCCEQVTKNGGMYLLMDALLEVCKKEGKELDFGGSQVEGVRNFNQRLGGNDKTYYTYNWDNSPFWFKLLKKIRKWVKK